MLFTKVLEIGKVNHPFPKTVEQIDTRWDEYTQLRRMMDEINKELEARYLYNEYQKKGTGF